MSSIIEDEDRSYPNINVAAPNPALYASEDVTVNETAWSPLASSPVKRRVLGARRERRRFPAQAAFNALARDLGVSSRYKFVDVLGLDDELLPAAALAFVAAFPTAAGEALPGAPVDDAKLWFLRQRAGGQRGAASSPRYEAGSAPTRVVRSGLLDARRGVGIACSTRVEEYG